MLPIFKLNKFRVNRDKRHYNHNIKSIRLRILKLGLILSTLVIVHSVIIYFTEPFNLWDSLWLTLTTLTTVGYGDYSASSVVGRLATIILLYSAGIALLAQIFGQYIDYRVLRSEYMTTGRWRWPMKNHILIINSPARGGEFYLTRLINQIRLTPKLAEKSIQILTPAFPEGLPQPLRELGVVHYHDSVFTQDSFEAVAAREAAYIIILASESLDISSDSLTYDTLGHLKEIKIKGRVIAECVLDENRKRFMDLRSNSVIRPIRAYPELLVRSMVAPGTERLMENLFIHKGDHATRYEINIDNIPWYDVASEIIKRDLGTPLGYVRSDGQLVCNPHSEDIIHASALMIMVRDSKIPTFQDVSRHINNLKSKLTAKKA